MVLCQRDRRSIYLVYFFYNMSILASLKWHVISPSTAAFELECFFIIFGGVLGLTQAIHCHRGGDNLDPSCSCVCMYVWSSHIARVRPYLMGLEIQNS